MHLWASMLTELPPTLQRLIARAQRISLPRHSAAPERHQRLRAALCRARVVRVTYFGLPREVQAAIQDLRATPRGLSPTALAARYGPIRSWSQIQADRRPQSISEQLVLLGWLLPRPTSPRHPARFLLPPELRAWLPHPLALPDHGPAPVASLPPALRAATTILLASAEQPVPLRSDGTFRAVSLRLLLPRLAPMLPAEARALCRFVLPLLLDQGLLAPHGAAAALAPAGERFLALPPDRQCAHLQAAWVAAPREDAWLMSICRDRRGIEWPLFRRRLLAWAEALPPQRFLDPDTLYAPLAQAFGPLADAQTHGLRRVQRVPWQPKRAAAIWQAAVRGPLTWLGVVAWSGAPDTADPTRSCYATGLTTHAVEDRDDVHESHPLNESHPPTWRYGPDGMVIVPHTAQMRAVLRLLPYAQWARSDATATVYCLTPRTLAAAMRQGHPVSALRALLSTWAGAVPQSWEPLLKVDGPQVRIIHTAVVTSDDPAILARATRQRSVRRYLTSTLAPGIAVVDPQRAEPLARALTRQHLGVAVHGRPVSSPPAAFTPAECATLLAACRGYCRHVPDGTVAPLLPVLEERLAAILPPSLRTTIGEVAPRAVSSPPLPSLPWFAAPQPALPMFGEPRRAADPDDLTPRLPSAAPVVLWTLLATLLFTFLPGPDLPKVDEPATEDSAAHTRPTAIDGSPLPDQDAAGATAPAIDPSAYLPLLRHAIARRRPVQIRYTAREAPAPTTRVVRPFRLESHGDCWYLHAYCSLAQADRCFRLDRIGEILLLSAPSQRTRSQRSVWASNPAPRRSSSAIPQASFFPAPPPPPSGSPLVRIWLE